MFFQSYWRFAEAEKPISIRPCLISPSDSDSLQTHARTRARVHGDSGTNGKSTRFLSQTNANWISITIENLIALFIRARACLVATRYMDFFPLPNNDTIIFEKSANYFDQLLTPKRVNALLGNNYIVVVLIDPAKRAYSWYQVRWCCCCRCCCCWCCVSIAAGPIDDFDTSCVFRSYQLLYCEELIVMILCANSAVTRWDQVCFIERCVNSVIQCKCEKVVLLRGFCFVDFATRCCCCCCCFCWAHI